MTGRDSVEVTALASGEEVSAASVLVSSHADYPAFAAVFPEPDRRRRALAPFFQATVRDAMRAGAAHGARGSAAQLLGVALWLPPGRSRLSASRKLRLIPAMTRVLVAAPTSFPTFARYGSNVERAHPPEPHWYLVVLGVCRDAQRQGVGTALLETGLRLVDSAGAACYLETSDRANVPFYERFGFEVQTSDLSLVPNGPSHVAMWRTPPGTRNQPS